MENYNGSHRPEYREAFGCGVKWGSGHDTVNHIMEEGLSGNSESLDLSHVCFVGRGKAFITAHHPYVLKTARCCFGTKGRGTNSK